MDSPRSGLPAAILLVQQVCVRPHSQHALLTVSQATFVALVHLNLACRPAKCQQKASSTLFVRIKMSLLCMACPHGTSVFDDLRQHLVHVQ